MLDGIKPSDRAQPFHRLPGLGPLALWGLEEGREQRGRGRGEGGSLRNLAEADFAVSLYRGACEQGMSIA